MTLDEALAEAVLGERVRAVDMQPGVFIDYNFAGWKINFPNGDCSGYSIKEHDKTVDWEVWVKPAPAPGWDMSAVKPVAPEAPPKRRGRPRAAFVPPPVIDDVDYGSAPVAAPKPNPWAEAGIADKPAPSSGGWAIFNKDAGK